MAAAASRTAPLARLLRAHRAGHRLRRRQPDVARRRKDGTDYVISGQKLFITNGTWADVALVFARTSDDGPRGVTAFLVPTDAPGFEAREIKGKLGLRGQATAELFLSDVRVPAVGPARRARARASRSR